MNGTAQSSAAAAAPASWRPYGAALGAILCWASLAAAVGESLHQLHPEQVLFYGLLTAGLALAARNALRERRPLPPWPGARVAALGLYGIWGYHTLLVRMFRACSASQCIQTRCCHCIT